MSRTTAQVIDDFTGRFNAKSDNLKQHLRLSPRLMELFFLALDYANPENHEIHGIAKGMEKAKILSAHLQELKKRGYVDNGDKRGVWKLTLKSIVAMEALLDGKKGEEPKKTAKAPKVPKTSGSKPPKTAKDVANPAPDKETSGKFSPPKDPQQVDIGSMTIVDIETRLDEIKAMVDAYTAEGFEMEKQLNKRFGDYRKPAAAVKKTARKKARP